MKPFQRKLQVMAHDPGFTYQAPAGPEKRSVTIAGHRTSLSMEAEFWAALKTIARSRRISLNRLIEQVDATREQRNLSSALRVHVLEHYARVNGRV